MKPSLPLLIVKFILAWYAVVYGSSLVLSSIGQFNRPAVLTVNILFLALITYLARNSFVHLAKKWRPRWTINYFFISLLLGLTFTQGLVSAPNTTDAMNYHLPRVMHWVQNKSVFQEHINNPQDFMPPLGGYAQAHLWLLAGNDRLVFLSQWVSYVGVIAAVYLILSFPRLVPHRPVGIALVASMPIVVLQATSSQVDLVTTFLMVAGCYFLIDFFESSRVQSSWWAGLAIALALAAKTTIWLYLPLFGFIGLAYLKRGWKPFFQLAGIGVLTLLLQAPWLLQNHRLFGSALGKLITRDGEIVFTNQTMSVGVMISNLVRNSLVQLPMPVGASLVEEGVEQLHQVLGVSANDERTTWYGQQFLIPRILYPQEDLAANPLQFVMILVALVALIRIRQRPQPVSWLLNGVGVCFVLFCLLLKWQPWHSRLLMPLLVLGTVAATVILHLPRKLASFIQMSSYLLALLIVLTNTSHPYFPYQFVGEKLGTTFGQSSLPASLFIEDRYNYYFYPRPEWRVAYGDIAAEIAKGQSSSPQVCLQLVDTYEYPLWIAIRTELPQASIHSRCANTLDAWLVETFDNGQYQVTKPINL